MKSFFRFLLLPLLLLLPSIGNACDICGCFMGVVPYERQSSIGLFHRYRAFNGYPDLGHRSRLFPAGVSWLAPQAWNAGSLPGESSHLYLPGVGHHHGSSPDDFEVFRVTELRMRWFVHNRLEVTALLPVAMNSARMDGRRLHVSGLGDPTFLAAWHVVTPNLDKKWKVRLIAGGGIKLPSGNFYATDSLGKRIEVLLQPGSGSVDKLAYTALALGYGKWGLSMNAMAKFNGENYYGERFAPGFTSNVQAFYRLGNNPNFVVMPQLSVYAEKTAGVIYRGDRTGDHAMEALLAGPGLDVFWKNVQFSSGLQFRVADNPGDHTQNAGRLFFGVTWNLTRDLRLMKGKNPPEETM